MTSSPFSSLSVQEQQIVDSTFLYAMIVMVISECRPLCAIRLFGAVFPASKLRCARIFLNALAAQISRALIDAISLHCLTTQHYIGNLPSSL